MEQGTSPGHEELVGKLIASPESYIGESYTDIFSLNDDQRQRFWELSRKC